MSAWWACNSWNSCYPICGFCPKIELCDRPLREVFGEGPHQRYPFHVVQDIVKAVLRAVASAHKSLAATHPTVPRGRPRTQVAKQGASKHKRWDQKSADVSKHQPQFVTHDWSTRDRKTSASITRGFPQWRKVRVLMEQVSALFDRRCWTQTARHTLRR